MLKNIQLDLNLWFQNKATEAILPLVVDIPGPFKRRLTII